MARLTLSEQVNKLASEVSTLNAQLQNAYSTLAARKEEIGALEAKLAELGVVKSDLVVRNQKIEELEKELKNQKFMREMYEKSSSKAEGEIEQAHAVLDSVDGAPSLEYEGPYSKLQRNIVTRLAGAFLAIARNGSVK